MNIPLAHVTSFLQFPVTIRRLYLYLSLNNHASLESTIIERTQKSYSRFFYDPNLSE